MMLRQMLKAVNLSRTTSKVFKVLEPSVSRALTMKLNHQEMRSNKPDSSAININTPNKLSRSNFGPTPIRSISTNAGVDQAEQIEKFNEFLLLKSNFLQIAYKLMWAIQSKHPKNSDSIIRDLGLTSLCRIIEKINNQEDFHKFLTLDEKTIALMRASWGMRLPIPDDGKPVTYGRIERAVHAVLNDKPCQASTLLLHSITKTLPQVNQAIEQQKNMALIISKLQDLIKNYLQQLKSTQSTADNFIEEMKLPVISYKLDFCKDWNSLKTILDDHPKFLMLLKNKDFGMGLDITEGLLVQQKLERALGINNMNTAPAVIAPLVMT